MNTRIVTILILATVAILTLSTRLWSISKYPVSYFADEVDAGYQALVFNHNRSDYFGNKYPIHFHSFSDWRTSANLYSIAFFQKLTGDNEVSIRLPSVIFGIASVAVFYLITQSVWAALLFSLSPWAIHFSRTGFEVSGMLLMFLLSIYFWQRFILHKKFNLLLLSLFFLALMPYFYSTSKLFIVIIFSLYAIIWRQDIVVLGVKKILISSLFLLLLLSPMIYDTLNGRSGFRFSYISIFTQPHREQVTDTMRYEDIYSDNIGKLGVKTSVFSKVLHNKYNLIAKQFFQNYMSAFSTEFLFQKGDGNLRQGFGTHGLLYIIDFFFIISGIIYLFQHPTKIGRFFFWLLILAPIPFSLTRDSLTPHSTRLILMLPSLIYFASISLRRITYLSIFYVISFLLFWHSYVFHYPQISARSYHANMKESVLAVADFAGPVYFSDTFEPFLPFFLFYTDHLPASKSGSLKITQVNNDFFDGKSINNRFFGHLSYNSSIPKNSLLVVPATEFKEKALDSKFNILKTIEKKYLSSEEFYLLSLKND